MSYKKAGSGDDGFSRLYDGTKVEKSSEIFEVLGDIDELNSLIGTYVGSSENYINAILTQIQNNLIELGSHIATPRTETNLEKNKEKITNTEFPDYYKSLEEAIKDIDSELPKLTKFLLPRGKEHHIRAVARRVERHMVTLYMKKLCSQTCIKYVNRLSDLFFVLARKNNPDVEYVSRKKQYSSSA